jgi:tetratricopeptide (TPR) repeat protein
VNDAYYALGSVYQEQSKLGEAEANFRKVMGSGKSELAGQAAIALADVYIKQGKSENALTAYNDIVRDYPNLTHLVYPKIGDLFYMQADYARAVEYYRKAAELVSAREMPGMQLKIAEALSAQGKIDDAIEEYLKVGYLYPGDIKLVVKADLRVGALYEEKGNLKEAANIYRKIVGMNVEESKYAQERIDLIKQRNR